MNSFILATALLFTPQQCELITEVINGHTIICKACCIGDKCKASCTGFEELEPKPTYTGV